jgi:hypothetical protein
LGIDPLAVRFVEQAARLAQAPAQFAARIVGDLPQQLAELAAQDRLRRQRQIGDQRAHLAGRRQRQHGAIPADGERPEHAQVQPRAVAATQVRFHGRFHAGTHGRPHMCLLLMPSMSGTSGALHD